MMHSQINQTSVPIIKETLEVVPQMQGYHVRPVREEQSTREDYNSW